MGAVALTNRTDSVTADGRRAVEATVTFSASYATGGDSVSLNDLGLDEVRRIEALSLAPDGWQVVSVITNPSAPLLKLQRWNGTAVAEQGAAADSSAISAKIRFIGS